MVLHVWSCPALCLCVFLSFWHFDHLASGKGSWSLCLSCICLLAMHTLICITFSLPPGVGGWLRLLLVALPVLFYLPFCVICFQLYISNHFFFQKSSGFFLVSFTHYSNFKELLFRSLGLQRFKYLYIEISAVLKK